MDGDRLRIGIDGRAIYKAMDGIGRYSLNLIRSLAEIDHRNEYFIIKNREIPYKITDAPNFHEVPVVYRHLSLRSVFCLPLVTRRFSLDVFHAPFFVCPIWGVENVVITVHDIMALTFPSFFSGRNVFKEKAAFLYHHLFVPLSIQKARKIISVSYSTKEALIENQKTKPEKICVIHEAVDDILKAKIQRKDVEAFRMRRKLPPEYLLYIGNMKPYKNFKLIILALEILRKSESLEQRLVIAGKKDRFFSLIYDDLKRRNLLDNVIFLDYVGDDELPLLFASASLFLFPSLCEGFGLPPLEAMAHGIPTIVSNTSSLPEVVGDGALLVHPRDPQDLAAAILSLTTDMGLRDKLSQKGVERSKAFSWQMAARQTLSIYEEVCNLKQSTAFADGNRNGSGV